MTLRKTTLADGTEIRIKEIEAYDTYREWIFGRPGPITNFDKHREGWMPEGEGLVVLPHETPEDRKGKRSPWYTVVALLDGKPRSEGLGFDMTSLKVVWLVDKVPDNLLDGLCEALHDLDWSQAIECGF
jgi:hypothetical protein